MVPKSWFGGVLRPCGGVLEPSGPENSTGCILGCENHVRGSPLGDVFWYNSWCFFVLFFVVFSSLRPERYFIDFYAILSLFSTPFLEVFCNKVEVVFFATLPSKTMIFKVPGLLFFSVFFQSFPHSIPDLIFLVFLVILGSPRLPF